MRSPSKICVILGASLVLSAACLGQAPLGSWRGRPQMTAPPAAAQGSETQRARIHTMIEQYNRMVVVLSVRGDHTFTWQTFGGPSIVYNHKVSGKWTQSGKSVVFEFPRVGNAQAGTNLTATLEKDGTTLNMTTESGTHILFAHG